MIRSLLLAAGFLIVTISLLFLQPSPRDGLSDDGFEEVQVTRADTAPAEIATREATSLRATESAPTDDAVVNAVRPVRQPMPQIDGDDQIAAMTRNILNALRAPGDTTEREWDIPVRSDTPEPAPAIAALTAPADVQQDLQRSAARGASDFELVQMVEDALRRGDIEARPEHMTAMGSVDNNALLASLLPGRVQPPRADVRRAFVYRIQPGDSLAGLATLFYGDPSDYARILESNADTLASADQITAGMLLNMPAEIQ